MLLGKLLSCSTLSWMGIFRSIQTKGSKILILLFKSSNTLINYNYKETVFVLHGFVLVGPSYPCRYPSQANVS